MKYGLYYYKNTHNIGDDVWAYAQSLFYPHIDYIIDNTTIYKFKTENNEKVASIIGAFVEPYNSEYSFFPPPNFIPLFVGAYFRPTMLEYINTELMRSYLLFHEPIGCRTKGQAEFLQKLGISAFFSGCISLTLPTMLNKKKKNYICLVDVPYFVSKYVENKVGDKFEIKYISHTIDDIPAHSVLSIDERFDIVKEYIDIYSQAHCVITSRLHTALPCLTQQTPVLLTITEEKTIGKNDIYDRMKDFYPFLNHNYYTDFINNKVEYDFINPPENPTGYLDLRNIIIEKCNNFINNCESGNINGFGKDLRNNMIDVLESKVVQLKNVIDYKNYCLSQENERILEYKNAILSLQKRLRKYETFNEWENIEYFGDWEKRSEVMSKYILQSCTSLLDLGCGEMHIRKFLSETVNYYGCDYKKRDADTIICDLSKGEFPNIFVDTVFISGVLEYLTNWSDVLLKCVKCCRQIVLSYSTKETATERDPIWVNCISENDIVDLLAENSFSLCDSEKYKTSIIFNFIHEV